MIFTDKKLDQIVEFVENYVGMSCRAWDMVSARDIVAAVIKIVEPSIYSEGYKAGQTSKEVTFNV
jgi:hypothetical protein